GVVDHRAPEPEDVGPTLLDDVARLDGVAERLRHLAALLVDHEAVRQHLTEWRLAAGADADQERAVKPAAMLIASLEVHVRGPRVIRIRPQHRLVARARVPPAVENVGLTLEPAASARAAGLPCLPEALDRPAVP